MGGRERSHQITDEMKPLRIMLSIYSAITVHQCTKYLTDDFVHGRTSIYFGLKIVFTNDDNAFTVDDLNEISFKMKLGNGTRRNSLIPFRFKHLG